MTFDVGDTAKVSGELNIQILNKSGFTDNQYTYYKGQPSRSKYKVDGWYDMDDNLISEAAGNVPFFTAGTGLWISGLENFKLTTSGEVFTKPVTTVFAEDGSKLIANPFPVAIKLTDMTFDIGETAKVTGELNIQILNKSGFTANQYTYYKGQPSRSKYKVDGWYDMDDNLISEDAGNVPTFPAGLALWISALQSWSVTIPAPTL